STPRIVARPSSTHKWWWLARWRWTPSRCPASTVMTPAIELSVRQTTRCSTPAIEPSVSTGSLLMASAVRMSGDGTVVVSMGSPSPWMARGASHQGVHDPIGSSYVVSSAPTSPTGSRSPAASVARSVGRPMRASTSRRTPAARACSQTSKAAAARFTGWGDRFSWRSGVAALLPVNPLDVLGGEVGADRFADRAIEVLGADHADDAEAGQALAYMSLQLGEGEDGVALPEILVEPNQHLRCGRVDGGDRFGRHNHPSDRHRGR